MLRFSTRRVLVIGLGLIGGSFARALRARSLVDEVLGYDRNRGECELGLSLGVIDRIADDLEAAVSGADLIVLAVPVKVMEQVLSEIKPWLRPQTLITDVGSTKGNLVDAARRLFDPMPPGFVPGHPIAGTEKSGVGASDEELFVRRKLILTPLPESDPGATLAIARLWQGVGSEVLQMEVKRHDEVLAATSHLPHLLAFSLVDTLAHEAENTDIFRYAAGGFRDFTRIAASDPSMWHDICFANRDQLLTQIDRFTEGVAKLREAIARGDSQSLLGIFTRAKSAREHFSRILARSAYSPDLHNHPVTFRVRPGSGIKGQADLPGDRSISHRAVMLAALAEGVTDIEGFLEGEDSLATLQAFRDLGVVIEGPHQGLVRVYGVGLHGLQPPVGPIYLGSSGTSMRLLCGVLAAQPFATELYGDEALSQVSMSALVEPLRQMGAQIETAAGGCPPLKITPVESLAGAGKVLRVASAQVKSALLLAGLYTQSQTVIEQVKPTRDHTERMLSRFGCELREQAGQLQMVPGARLTATRLRVPGDLSAAAFFIVAASLTPGAELLLEHVGINPTRIGLLSILQQMGAEIELLNVRDDCAEPVADIRVRAAVLKGIEIPAEWQSLALDECPALLVAAACAEGVTTLDAHVEGAFATNRRLNLMSDALQQLGIDLRLEASRLIVKGGQLHGGRVSSGGDPRVAMALAVAGHLASEELDIEQCASVALFCPEFVDQARRIGIALYKEEG
ncbi:3-phosphoshikimate 1-carboxyvinyltransferase [Marinobacterium zhoushanense]|uniref:3-phosphoshikimate 1-carboxyvinyltransferase n=1 Tax=Marinobacterium zhoushanense TaxID=1679163 RepID=A0ABQ1K8P0_9GAMM|nr:bifunctional prephenate dehydrogenase/3-phosphoshikimate 1-carboxyvinyltransferase [Marinobacterium zhoushanense]GGB88120.1 3-phosphoshikimate 1-carboxyvinyltransferase [Marinobacterium zhoushanense]